MKNNYLKVRQFLEDQFPELKGQIKGEHYPVPPILSMAQNVVSFLQVVAMAWIGFGGETIFRFVGFSTPPAIFYTIREFGTQIAVALFFLIPQLIGHFQTNGAFEVVLDGQRVIWSKLEEGRFPTADELTQPLIKLGLEAAASKAYS